MIIQYAALSHSIACHTPWLDCPHFPHLHHGHLHHLDLNRPRAPVDGGLASATIRIDRQCQRDVTLIPVREGVARGVTGQGARAENGSGSRSTDIQHRGVTGLELM